MCESFQEFAAQQLKKIRESHDDLSVGEKLRESLPSKYEFKPDQFAFEYHLLRYALGCRFWESVCLENGIEDEAVQKAFMREMMAGYQSPTQINQAKGFSEYLHEGREVGDDQALLMMLEKFFGRLSLTKWITETKRERRIGPAFQELVGILQAFQSQCKRELGDFILKRTLGDQQS